jgi:hypothetical protein
MVNKPPPNHGEGDPEAAQRFNEAEAAFVKSERGRAKIQKGPQVRPEEEGALAAAEREAGEHGKADDSCSVLGTKNKP